MDENIAPQAQPAPAPTTAPEPAPASAPEPAPTPVPAPTPTPQRRSFGERLTSSFNLLQSGLKRFPMLTALAAVASIITILRVLGIIESSYGIVSSLVAIPGFGIEEQSPSTIFLNRLSDACYIGAAVAVAAQVVAERVAEDKNPLIVQIAASLIAVVVTIASAYLTSASSLGLLHVMLCACISLVSSALILWATCTRENQNGLIPRFVLAAVYSAFLVGVLFIGALIIWEAINTLLFKLSYEIIEVIAIIVWSFIYPVFFCSRIPRADEELETPRAWNVIVGDVVLGLFLVLTVVLYGYIAKVFITGDLPSGEMNWFGSFALLVWMFLWLGARSNESNAHKLFIRWGWILLIPVVAMQLYCVWIRVSAYGLTTLRYSSLLCTALGIFALILAAFNASPRVLYIAAAVVCAIATISPANVVDVPNFEQTARLKSALEQAGILKDGEVTPLKTGRGVDEDTVKQIYSAWDYVSLSDRIYFRDSVVDRISEKMKDGSPQQVFGVAPESTSGGYATDPDSSENDPFTSEESTRYYNFETKDRSIDVADYSRVYALSDANWSNEISDATNYKTTFEFPDKTKVEIDLTELVGELLAKADEESSSYLEIELDSSELTLDISNEERVVFDYIWISVEKDGATDVNVSGYYLVAGKS